MTDVNVAELRRALEEPTPPYGGQLAPTDVIVNRSTLAALLDAYERDQPASGFEEWWSEHGEELWLTDPDMLTRKDYARAAYEAGRTSEWLAADLEEADG